VGHLCDDGFYHSWNRPGRFRVIFPLDEEKRLVLVFCGGNNMFGTCVSRVCKLPITDAIYAWNVRRFLLPSYCLLAILAGIGFSYVMSILTKIQISIGKKNIHADTVVTVLVFIVLIASAESPCGNLSDIHRIKQENISR